MRAAVTGATGLLGGNLAVHLREAGHHVVATRRASSRTAHLDRWGIEWVEAPLGDVDALSRVFDGADVVFHVAAAVDIVRDVTPLLQAVNVDGTHNVLRAMAGAGRLVHCSSTVAVGISTDGEPVTEDAVWNLPELGLADGYATTKRQSEEVVRAWGGDAVVVNPGFMFGPFDVKPSSGTMIQQLMRGRIPGYSTGRNSFVDVRDVAAGMVLAAEKGKRGERYILAGENLGYGEIFERIAAVAGVQAPKRAVPKWIARIGGWGGDAVLALGGNSELNSNTVDWGYTSGFVASSAKAERELGYTRRPVDHGIQACLDWWMENAG
jgi:dihydroflavonol-4-reductase